MNEYLLNTNVVIITSIIAAFSCLWFHKRLFPTLSRKMLVLLCSLGILLFISEMIILNSTFGLQQTPASGYYIVFVIDILIAEIIYVSHNPKMLLRGTGALLACVILLGVTVNDYYQYFPTVQAAFMGKLRKPEASATVSSNHLAANKALPSIEENLYGNGTSKGSVVSANIPGLQSHLNARDAYIYLPPSYNDAAFASIKFPAIILLTGTPGSPSSWLQGGRFENIMNDFAAHHNGISPIVIIADHSGGFSNDTECLDSSHGNAETYLTADVPAYAKSHYRISDNPANWGIAGFSEGGMCAAMLTLTHQSVFHHFVDIAGDPFPYLNNPKNTLPILFAGSKTQQKEHNIDWLMQNISLTPGITAQFAIGGNDNKRLIAELQHTYRLASARKIPATFESIAHHGHDFTAWSYGYRDALPKLSYYLGATQCETNCSP